MIRLRTIAALAALWATTAAGAAEQLQTPAEFGSQWVYRPLPPLSSLALQGQRLFLDGVRADGTLLKGVRQLADGQPPMAVSGAQVSCAQCHGRSGMGTVEGDVLVSPITGNALYQPGTMAAPMDMRTRKFLNTAHPPYTLDTLGLALREGRNAAGHDMHKMMPRYELSDEEVKALDAYLQTLSQYWSPGISVKRIRLAAVITPDVDPAQRKIAINMMQQIAGRKNLGTRPGRRHMVSALEFVLRTERQWDFNIWELTGPKDTWGAQLRQKQAENPVFAIASGLARDWTPVHEFCESEHVPCWFPVAESLPVSAGKDHYGLYFNQGVALEADVIAKKLAAQSGKGKAARVIQVASADEVASRAATELDAQLAQSKIKTVTMQVQAGEIHEVTKALSKLSPQDTVVLWLRPEDLGRVTAAPAPRANVWIGAELAGGEHAKVPTAWRAHAMMAYQYELPWKREGNMAGMVSFLETVKQPLQDEALQSQLFFSLNYLNETLGEMLNNLHRDYLIERAETMLTRREEQTANAQVVSQRSLRKLALDQVDAGRAVTAASAASDTQVPVVSRAALNADRVGTTIYPRLSLGRGQRYASKGAWVVKLSGDQPDSLFSKDAEWVVP